MTVHALDGREVFTESDPRFRIAAARRMLYRCDLDSQIGGHVSLRADDDSFWVTPIQYLDETLPGDVRRFAFDLSSRDEQAMTASPAVSFHAALYIARPDVGCIVHTHSRQISLLTTTGAELDCYYTYAAIFLDDMADTFHDDPSLTPDREGDALARALADKRAMMMSHHGALHVGPSIEVTVADAICLELCARYQNEAIAIGGKPMDRATAVGYRDIYAKVGFRELMWEANYRRLRRSDPDLFATLDDPCTSGAGR